MDALPLKCDISWDISFFLPQGIKGDRGPPGGPGDKGDKVYLSFMTRRSCAYLPSFLSVFKEMFIMILSDII